MAWNIYDQTRFKNTRSSAGMASLLASWYCALVANAYTPDQAAHDFWNDVSANEVSGTNYTAGGNQLTNPTCTISGAGLLTWDADDPATWAQHASGFSNARRAIIRRNSGSGASADEIIAYSDAFAADRGNVSGSFSIALSASGIFTQAR